MHLDASPQSLVDFLRAAGCVFAEDEAAILQSSAETPQELRAWATRRAAGEPLEHIVGWVDFGGERLSVGPGVFVPRQRSLLLARTTATLAEELDAPMVLEAYCGAAPLATYVARHAPRARVAATDISSVALEYAKANMEAARPGADWADNVFPGDVLAGLPARLRGTIDVIAAVPPYVPSAAVDFLPHEAREHEPEATLVGGKSGLDHFASLLREAGSWLSRGGTVSAEMGQGQADEAARLAASLGYALATTFTDDEGTAVLRFAPSAGTPAGNPRHTGEP